MTTESVLSELSGIEFQKGVGAYANTYTGVGSRVYVVKEGFIGFILEYNGRKDHFKSVDILSDHIRNMEKFNSRRVK